MASPDRSTGGTLKRIYESGEWSDLTISTATRDFHVHKNIVCPACPFFEAAFTRDFQEARTGVIKLPESAQTVDGMMKFVYGIDVAQATVENAAATNIDHFCECVDLHVASDKYDLQGLREITVRAIIAYAVCMDTPQKIVTAGLYLFQQPSVTIDNAVLNCSAIVTARALHNIRKSPHIWQQLLECPDFLSATLDHVLDTTDLSAIKVLPNVMKTPEIRTEIRRVFHGLRELGFYAAK